MDDREALNNSLFLKLIEKSIFTKKQIQIIYRINRKGKRPTDISTGAYYREIKQSKSKTYKLIYSLILLELLNIVDHDQLLILSPLIEQLKQLQNNHKNYHTKDLMPIINVMDEMIIRLVRL